MAALALALTVAVVRSVGTRGYDGGAVPRRFSGSPRDALGDELVGSPDLRAARGVRVGLATIAVDRTLASVLRFAGACAAMLAVAYAAFLPFHLHTTPCTKVSRAGTAAAPACSTT